MSVTHVADARASGKPTEDTAKSKWKPDHRFCETMEHRKNERDERIRPGVRVEAQKVEIAWSQRALLSGLCAAAFVKDRVVWGN